MGDAAHTLHAALLGCGTRCHRFAGIMLRVPPSLGHAPPVKPPRRYVVEDGAPSLFEEDKANRGSVWHHLKTSYRHLVQVVGLGPKGLLRMRHADWNDEVLQHVPPSQRIGIATHGESVLVSAMAVYVTGYRRPFGLVCAARARYLDSLAPACCCCRCHTGTRCRNSPTWLHRAAR